MNSESIKPIAVLIVTVAVNIANVAGYAIDADLWINIVLSGLSLVAVGYSWWKNQNVTIAAQMAQDYLDELKYNGVK